MHPLLLLDGFLQRHAGKSHNLGCDRAFIKNRDEFPTEGWHEKQTGDQEWHGPG